MLSDLAADLIEQRLDVAVRIGELGADTLRVRKVGALRRVLVAAPGYLSRHGYPRRPDDLASHSCVIRTFGPEGSSWPLMLAGSEVRIPVKGNWRCNDAAAANAAVLHGAGIGLAPLWQVREDIDGGRLEMLLQEHEPPPIQVSAVWPNGSRTPVRTRYFIDMLAHRLSGERI
ncbi:MAG: LysR family transcriptional regulator [Ramlibacter sp.]|nr:LysR family transcriptional regulator [Ramlibacter sp.]